MDAEFPKIVRDKVPSLIAADGRTPVVEFADDSRMIGLLGARVAEKARKLAEAPSDRVVREAAGFRTVLRAYCAETGITEADAASVPARDGHSPRQFAEHADALAHATSADRTRIVADMLLSFANLRRERGIPDDALDAEEARQTEERGGYGLGVVLRKIET